MNEATFIITKTYGGINYYKLKKIIESKIRKFIE